MYAIAAAFLLSVAMVPAVSATCDATKAATCLATLASSSNITAPPPADQICPVLTTYVSCLKDSCGGTLDAASKALVEAQETGLNVTCPGLLDNGANLQSAMSPLLVVASALLLLLFHFPA